MSERQEDIRARQEAQALAMRQQLWSGVDPSVIERWAGMVPAGFQFGDSRDTNAAMNWAPGRVMTPEEVQQVVANVSNNTIEGQGMDLASYLANPRAAIKVENGQYVYRPESLMPENDFQGIQKTGFWDGMGPAMLPLIAFGAGPFAASLGAAGGAAAAGGAEAAGAGAAGAGEFGASFAPTITPSTVAQSGLLYSGGSMPTVAGLTGVGGLTAEGAAALAAMGSAGAGLGAGTTGALGSLGLDAAGNIVSQGVNLANSATTAAGLGSAVTGAAGGAGAAGSAAGSAGSTAASALSKATGPDQGTTDILGKLLGAGVGYLGSKEQTDALTNLQNQLTAQRAPFLNKAVGYLNNPDSFYTSPEATGAANATMRALSTKFGNPGVSPTAQGLATGALYDRYANTVNSLGSLGLSGQGIQANLGQQIATTSGQPYAIAGNTISGLTSDDSMSEMMKRMFSQQFGLR